MQLLVQQLAPIASPFGFGIETLETGSYVLQAYRPATGVQFFVTADLRTENLAGFLVSSAQASHGGAADCSVCVWVTDFERIAHCLMLAKRSLATGLQLRLANGHRTKYTCCMQTV
jgi:hypothetical protein